ncbi:response regulator [Flaviaesturariibacter aridisoli]|uniref:Response regulator n=1 Tax=Flaviaesturariibacter aridisoli TaxID=2545761 RepID=A0A4R4E5Q7_9BACT|nr:response regulator [Flaviaesturariibacter aridisoli]TCZ74357.1 response regulator [Flaviaesturariibacter aridisoli]
MPEPAPHANPFVFLAEDDVDDQELLIEALAQYVPAMQVQTAANGKKAMTQLLALPPQQLPCLIILDYNLPEVNGGEILKQLAAEERYAPVPKVVWSTSNSPLYRQICMDLGARAYFVKPSDIKGIEKMAQEMLAYCQLVTSS